ncbi:MAG: hypothetical protein U5L09_02545 [Bacteroidales bacterium]|nr:hypothetical protein [Bacteroidales bacterium]
MKKTVFTLAAAAFIAGILLSGCNSSSQKIEKAEDKVQKAKEDVIDAKNELNLALQDSVTDFQHVKTVFQNQILANEKSIAELKFSIARAARKTRPSMRKSWLNWKKEITI